MLRILRVLAIPAFAGLLVGCNQVPGGTSETAMNFQENAEEMCEGSYEDCTASEAIDVLDVTVKSDLSGSHADLNAAKVALDKGEDSKAASHLAAFADKAAKERGKKIPEDDADFMIFMAQEIIDKIYAE